MNFGDNISDWSTRFFSNKRKTSVPVGAKLASQACQIREFHLVTYLRNEGQPYVKAVDILIEIEDIGLNGHGIAVPDCRAHTYVAHSVILPSHGLHADKVNSSGRDELERLIKLHIGRREAQCASKPVSRNHDPVETVSVS